MKWSNTKIISSIILLIILWSIYFSNFILNRIWTNRFKAVELSTSDCSSKLSWKLFSIHTANETLFFVDYFFSRIYLFLEELCFVLSKVKLCVRNLSSIFWIYNVNSVSTKCQVHGNSCWLTWQDSMSCHVLILSFPS